MMKTNTRIVNTKLYKQAYNEVIRVRGSWDVPAFDLCVEAEYERLLNEHSRT